MDTTAKVRTKGLDATGVTEDIANQMYLSKGGHYMAIVELEVVERHEKHDGKKRVDLVLTQVEPAIDAHLADHLRELTRVLHRNRAQTDGQMAIDDSLAPSVDDVLAAGAQHKAHPYLASTLSTDDDPVCDVCGTSEESRLHHMPTVDPFAIDDEDELDEDAAELAEAVEEDQAYEADGHAEVINLR